MDLLKVPDWERWSLKLRCRSAVSLPFFHGALVRDLLCWARGGTELPPGLIPFAPESGRKLFVPDDRYVIGLTLIGEARGILPTIPGALRGAASTPVSIARPRAEPSR